MRAKRLPVALWRYGGAVLGLVLLKRRRQPPLPLRRHSPQPGGVLARTGRASLLDEAQMLGRLEPVTGT
jgi:hypothetical protein